MRSMHAAAAVLIAAGVLFQPLVTAPMAAADPVDDQIDSRIDDVFTKAVRNEGLRITAKDAIDLAHSTCDVLARGGDVDAALRHIRNATEWKSGDDISKLASLAVQAYCPTENPNS